MWKFHPSSMFSTRSFCSIVETAMARNIVGSTTANRVWKGLAPPRAELQVQFVIQGRLNTRDRLSLLNIIPPVAAVCPMCSSAAESVTHIFFECIYSWRMWTDCLCWWGFLWCSPNDLVDFFHAWCGVKLSGVEKKMWMSLFYVVIWSLWNIRKLLYGLYGI